MGSLWLDISLWSADLANLQAEIRRLEPFADSFHMDVCDGHYAPNLLFFPDLVARLRELTRVEFHVHLMATRPMDLLPSFLQAGADRVTVPIEVGKRAWPVVEQAKSQGRKCGVSIELDTPLDWVKPFRGTIDTVLMMGTAMGVKGCSADERVYERISETVKLCHGAGIAVVADGGIREESVPMLRAAGADGIVPGSLICKTDDLAKTVDWLKGL